MPVATHDPAAPSQAARGIRPDDPGKMRQVPRFLGAAYASYRLVTLPSFSRHTSVRAGGTNSTLSSVTAKL
jgi:hypothetical protein